MSLWVDMFADLIGITVLVIVQNENSWGLINTVLPFSCLWQWWRSNSECKQCNKLYKTKVVRNYPRAPMTLLGDVSIKRFVSISNLHDNGYYIFKGVLLLFLILIDCLWIFSFHFNGWFVVLKELIYFIWIVNSFALRCYLAV